MEGNYKTLSCSVCDLLLESRLDSVPPAPVTAASGPATPAPVWAAPAGAALLETVIAADDTEGILRSLTKTLADRGIARTVLPAANGVECLIHYHQSVAAGRTPQLVILDVNMPILNGINAAIGLRAAERASGVTAPVPILFFTSTPCDDSFKRVLQFTSPARYLNKGAAGTAQEFADRLVAVLLRLLNPAAASAATSP